MLDLLAVFVVLLLQGLCNEILFCLVAFNIEVYFIVHLCLK